MTNVINNIKRAIFSATHSEDAQGALEYIAMVLGLVVLVSVGFKIAGGNILDEASSFVTTVINGVHS